MRKLRHPLIAAIVAVTALLGGLSATRAEDAPPPAVVVETVKVEPIEDPEQFTARVEAIESVDIVARVQGFLENIAFEPGQQVAAGALLFEIEREQYEAEVAAAQAQVAQAQAAAREAERNLTRIERLVREQSVSEATLDEARANAEIAEANLQTARAELRAAELNLSHTRITAPFDGQIGLNRYSVGTLVGPQSGPLARLIQLDPIRVVFSVPEGTVVTRQQQAGGDGVAGSRTDYQPRLRLPNGTEYPHTGRIDYIANEVDPSTGTLPVRVAFPNPRHLLIPNQFVTLFLFEAQSPRRPVVPQSAVLQDREGRYVFLLTGDQTVTRRRIRTGARVEHGWAVQDGLEGGERLVVQGVQRLSDGARVQPATRP